MFQDDHLRYTPTQTAWLIFRRLKELPEDASHAEITDLLVQFKSLGLEGECLPASLVLRTAIKRRDYAGLYSFLAYWHRKFRFRDADRERYRPDSGREVLSLEEMFRIAVARCWANQPRQEALNAWAEPLLGAWVAEPQGDGWVSYHYGRGLQARGRREEAAVFVCDSVRRNQRAGWAWRNLAELLIGDEEHEYAVLRHAVALQTNPQFWGDEAERLVGLMVARGAFEEARWISLTLLSHRDGQGWRVKPWLQTARRAPWLQGEGRRLDARQTERDAQLVLAAVSGDEITEFMIDHQNPVKSLAWAVDGERGLPLPYRRFREAQAWPVGARVYLVIHGQRAVYAFRREAA